MSIAKRHNKLRGLIKAGKFEPAFDVEDNGTISAEDWPYGFVHAMEIHAQAWEPLLTSEERAQLVMPLLALLGEADAMPEFKSMAPHEKDALVKSVPDMLPACVSGIAKFWKEWKLLNSAGDAHGRVQ